MTGTKSGTQTGRSTPKVCVELTAPKALPIRQRPEPAMPDSFEQRVWYLVMSQPGRELYATHNLLAGGYSAWLPLCSVVVRHARKASLKRAPLFPGYLFVGLSDGQAFAPVLATFGVAAVVRAGIEPLPVRQGTLDRVAGVLADHERGQLAAVRQGGAPANPFHAGQSLRVSEGPLSGLEGICTMAAGARTAVLLQFLGGEQRAVLPNHMLRAVK